MRLPRLRLHLAAASLFTLVGCSGSPSDGGESTNAINQATAKGTVLAGTGADDLELTFGMNSDGTSLLTARRGTKSQTFRCESDINFEKGKAYMDRVGIACYVELVAGWDYCDATFKRTAPSEFSMDVSCTLSNTTGTPGLPPLLASTFEILTGAVAPAKDVVSKTDITLKEVNHSTDPFSDEVAFVESLVPAMQELLTKKATMVSFRTRVAEEMEITRVSAHPRFATHATQVMPFAGSYSASADAVPVEGAPGKLASTKDIVDRVVSTARCTEAPPGQPNCLH